MGKVKKNKSLCSRISKVQHRAINKCYVYYWFCEPLVNKSVPSSNSFNEILLISFYVLYFTSDDLWVSLRQYIHLHLNRIYILNDKVRNIWKFYILPSLINIKSVFNNITAEAGLIISFQYLTRKKNFISNCRNNSTIKTINN